MKSQWQNVNFLSHVNIKNIIGKELINDDSVAVMELVKNAYDAGAKNVTVEFRNLKESREQHELLIVDDGNGMSKEDILHKWLNLAYSIKRVQNTQNNRLQAGNKGIGRFSCDRLGKKLDIYTKNETGAYQLKINWEDFENIHDYSVQINEIPMKLRSLSDHDIKQETGFDIKKNGTIIKISYLRDEWAKFNGESLFNEVLNYQKFVTLRSHLEKLINKSQVDSDDFRIFLNVPDIDKTEEAYLKVNGEIQNRFFEKLNFNTTYIHSAISDDGKYIITQLKDRDEVVFKTIEKNTEFPDLKNVKIILMHLNPYGKVYFYKQMGIRSVNFGSVYLFINGFRIPPYGEPDNDAFGLEGRKGQGQRRHLGGRDIIGRIEIEDRDDQYKIISSREGIAQNEAYLQLIHKSTKSSKSQLKNNGFFYKTLRKLEKYVVDGLAWDGVPKGLSESKITSMMSDSDWTEDQEIYAMDRDDKLANIAKKVFYYISIDAKSIVDLQISTNLLSYLVDEMLLNNSKSDIERFLKDFFALPSHVIDENLSLFVNKLLALPDSDRVLEKYKNFVNLSYSDLIESFDKDDTYQQLNNKIKILEDDEANLKKELELVKAQKYQQEKQILFLQSIQTLDKDQLLNLQHHIGLYSHDIEGALISFKRDFKKNNGASEEQIFNFIDRVTLANKKVLTINKLATKSNFLTDSEVISADIVVFIEEYVNTIYLVEDSNRISIVLNTNGFSFITNFSPFELTIVLDNILSNAKKVNKPNKVLVVIDFFKYNDSLVIKVSNTGKGLDKTIDDPLKIFDKGFTTTSGSGLGLYHVKQLLKKMNFDISVNEFFDSGFQLVLSSK